MNILDVCIQEVEGESHQALAELMNDTIFILVGDVVSAVYHTENLLNQKVKSQGHKLNMSFIQQISDFREYVTLA